MTKMQINSYWNFNIDSKDFWQKRSIDPLAFADIEIFTANCGIKYKNRDDLLLIKFAKAMNIAAIFTKSACPSAAVDHCRSILSKARARAILVNAGNANAFTGKLGVESTAELVQYVASLLNCAEDEVYLCSTGVIGEPLDTRPIIKQLQNIQANSAGDWLDAAKAIMTTDSFAKIARRDFIYNGKKYHLQGIAKGSGMIAPDMATMLSFITTDLAVKADILQIILQKAADNSFNSISVDSDCSTSDSVLCFCPDSAEAIDNLQHEGVLLLLENLTLLLQDLALQIVSDGEGASHLIKIEITGAKSQIDAEKIAFAIANSPLVKTAIAGNDANWGRIVMAVGKAGALADRDKLAIYFGDYCLARQGQRALEYDEALVSSYMKNYQINIKVDLGLGEYSKIVWSCDFTKEYVAINADYRS